MITFKCEACGRSEDYSSHFDKDDGGKLSRVNSKLCHNCARVYREIEQEKAKIYKEDYRNMVTEVRKKLGNEPHQGGRIGGPAVSLHELLNEWIDAAEIFGSIGEHNQKLFNLLSSLITRQEGPG